MDEGFDNLSDNVIDPDRATKVVSSKTVKDWENQSPVKQFPGRITKAVIPIDFGRYHMMMTTKVEPGVKVDLHAHEEPVFRYVIEGKLTLNGVEYEPGDWILVPSKVPYQVQSDTGYTVLASYGQKCGAPPDKQISKKA